MTGSKRQSGARAQEKNQSKEMISEEVQLLDFLEKSFTSAI